MVDGDPGAVGVLWGDVGTLYWLALREDLARGDLSNTRFVMQCC